MYHCKRTHVPHKRPLPKKYFCGDSVWPYYFPACENFQCIFRTFLQPPIQYSLRLRNYISLSFRSLLTGPESNSYLFKFCLDSSIVLPYNPERRITYWQVRLSEYDYSINPLNPPFYSQRLIFLNPYLNNSFFRT